MILGDENAHTTTNIGEMAGIYGKVIQVVRVHQTCWKVTYPLTVIAVAAVLALDSLYVSSKKLKAMLEVGDREKKLHVLIVGHY